MYRYKVLILDYWENNGYKLNHRELTTNKDVERKEMQKFVFVPDLLRNAQFFNNF